MHVIIFKKRSLFHTVICKRKVVIIKEIQFYQKAFIYFHHEFPDIFAFKFIQYNVFVYIQCRSSYPTFLK